jgi:hypothetical protein
MLMLQFPAPFPPDEIRAPTSFEQLVSCLFITMTAAFLVSTLLPSKHFVALFKIAFPWMPERLE